LGTDAHRFTFRPYWYQSRFIDVTGLLVIEQHGSDRIDREQDKGVPKDISFPSGIHENTTVAGIGIHGQLGGNVVLDVLSGFQEVVNPDNRALNPGQDGPFFELKLTTLWWSTIGL
jgi:hypothetical protein